MIERLGGVGALQETLVAALVSVGAVVVSCFAVAVVTHGGAEEHDGRTEEVLATATARSTAFLAVVLVALGGAAWLLLVTGLAHGVGAVGAAVPCGGVLAAALVQIPAVWVVAGLALLGLARGSRWAVAGWAVLVAFFLVGPLAELLRLPGWVADLSPYSHVPKVPAESLRDRPRAGPDRARGRCSSPRPGGATGRATSASVRAMWEPDPAWHAVSGGTGTSTVGVWRTEPRTARPLVVKRLGAPGAGRPAGAQRPAPLRLLAPRGRRRDQRGRPSTRRPACAAPRSTSPRTTRGSR